MKLELLQKKLLAAAKANPPSDQVPHAFEKRILAHLQSQSQPDAGAFWARAMWRAVIPCVAITVVLSVFAFLPVSAGDSEPVVSNPDLSQAFEQTLLAATDSTEDVW